MPEATPPAGAAETRHPLFARCLARSAAIAERKGAGTFRARLVEGLAGRVLEVGAGTGIQFRHYPPTVAEVEKASKSENIPCVRERFRLFG
jgi:hypothetical protein